MMSMELPVVLACFCPSASLFVFELVPCVFFPVMFVGSEGGVPCGI